MKTDNISLHILIFSCALFGSIGCLLGEKTMYDFSGEPIDVVIPAINKDLLTLDTCIEGIKKYGDRIRNIYVVSPESLTKKAHWIDENSFPFSKFDIAAAIFKDSQKAAAYLKKPGNRIGWVCQQLLKLYAPLVIPEISSNVLVLDADTIFMKPVTFLNEKSEPLFNVRNKSSKYYFVHAKKLVPNFRKIFPKLSGVTHHMLIQRPVISNLFNVIKSAHGMEMWEAFCHCISLAGFRHNAASEFEIYFNFIFSTTDQCHIRRLKWKNSSEFDRLSQFRQEGYHFVSFHSYLRRHNKRRHNK